MSIPLDADQACAERGRDGEGFPLTVSEVRQVRPAVLFAATYLDLGAFALGQGQRRHLEWNRS